MIESISKTGLINAYAACLNKSYVLYACPLDLMYINFDQILKFWTALHEAPLDHHIKCWKFVFRDIGLKIANLFLLL